MNAGKSIFSQLMDFLPTYEFRQCVERYQGNYKLKSFSCWDQFLCMAFAQLTYRESLRDIEACLRANQTKLYHMGIRGRVSRNTLANANSVRDWRIYADFAQSLIAIARPLYLNEPFGVEFDGNGRMYVAEFMTAAHLVLVWQERDDPNLLRHAARAKEVGRNPRIAEYEPSFGPSASYYAWEAACGPVHGVRAP